MRRRRLIATALLPLAAPALAQPAFPNRPIRVAAFSLVPMGNPAPDAIRDFVLREASRWAPVVRASGAEPS